MSEENPQETDNLPSTASDAPTANSPISAPKNNNESRLQRLKDWYVERKKLTIPLSVLLLILLLGLVPFTRYALAGTVLKKDVTVKVMDSSTNTPVSGAKVSIGSISSQTDGSGKAVLHGVKVGHHKAQLSKKYYLDKTVDVISPIFSQKSVPSISLTATGRQVKVTVSDLINKKRLQGVNISVAGTTAKTDRSGSALIVVPAGSSQEKVKLSLDGYNDATVSIDVSGGKIQDNQVTMTPSGKVYFLSKLSGKIDVVKTNLDGTDRKTVLAGTGKEDDRNTVLLASRDWKYLALLSRRAGSSPTLYLIDTADDNLSTIDEGSADFSLAGWVNDNFVYTVTRNNVQLWQAGRQVIKSFNAQTKKLTALDQTGATGSDQTNYISELVGPVYAYNNLVYYIKNWTAAYTQAASTDFTSKQATFNSIKPDGTAKKAIRSFGLASGTQAIDITLEERIASPDSIKLKFSDGAKDNFYVYSGGQVKTDSTTTGDSFYSADYATYLQSPSGSQTFWSESRDGKNTLFLGDEDGQGGKQIVSLSDYNTYGWFTDDYLLVSKNSSELYIAAKNTIQSPIKISDYHKPAATFPGYGGGYGGI